MLIQGQLLVSRGGLMPGLLRSGFDEPINRRSWAAFRYGKWEASELIENWQRYVLEQGEWEAHRYQGYRVLAVDWVGYFRPRLQNWWGKHYHAVAERALSAVVFGVMVRVGQVNQERVPLLRGKGSTDAAIMKAVLKEMALKQTSPVHPLLASRLSDSPVGEGGGQTQFGSFVG